MLRILAACSLGLAAVLPLGAPQIAAHERGHSDLDRGLSIGQSWSATQRFDLVTHASSDDLVITRGDRWQIRATGSPAVLAELRFLVEDGKLIVGRRWSGRSVRGNARIEVTAPAVEDLVLAGSGNVTLDALSGRSVGATVAGSGTVDVGSLRASRLEATIAGSGSLRIAGEAGNGKITIAGSGNINGRSLRLQSASVSIAGSGSARFSAEGRVSASIVGSGDATVTGTNDCTQTRVGSGRLTCTL